MAGLAHITLLDAANYGFKDDPISNFNSIKGLIIKSADIVDAYYEETSYRMQSAYVAQSAFGVKRRVIAWRVVNLDNGIFISA